MRYYELDRDGGPHLVARDGETAYDLTEAAPELTSFWDLSKAARVADEPIDAIARTHVENAATVPVTDLGEAARPIVPDEVWAAGVTYHISEEAREAESGMPEVYLRVYEGDRPELFFKATPQRTVGPGDEVGIRGDSDWDVPEPELGVVVDRGSIVGYTVGNDVSSRSIEGENPLYLPQAKVYDRCCSVGPCVATPETVGDPHDLTMTMRIERDGETVYTGETSTAEMVRSCEELVEYLTRHDELPDRVVLLTGTALVPPDDFTLRVGDDVSITIEGIGTLENGVTEV